MVQVPTVMPVTELPLIVQTLGVDEYLAAAKPALVTANITPVPPTTIVGAVPKWMVWLALSTLKLCVTWAAALYWKLPA